MEISPNELAELLTNHQRTATRERLHRAFYVPPLDENGEPCAKTPDSDNVARLVSCKEYAERETKRLQRENDVLQNDLSYMQKLRDDWADNARNAKASFDTAVEQRDEARANLEAARAQNVVLTGRVAELEGKVKDAPVPCRCNVCGDVTPSVSPKLFGAKCPTNYEGKTCSGRVYPTTAAPWPPEPQPATEPATRPDQITAMRNETQKAVQERDAAIADLAAVRAEASAEIARLKGVLAGKGGGMVYGPIQKGKPMLMDADDGIWFSGNLSEAPENAPQITPNNETPVKAVKTPQIATETPKTGEKPRRVMSEAQKAAMAAGKARRAAANAPGIDSVWQNADGTLKTLLRAQAKALTPQQAKARKKQQQAIYAKKHYEKTNPVKCEPVAQTAPVIHRKGPRKMTINGVKKAAAGALAQIEAADSEPQESDDPAHEAWWNSLSRQERENAVAARFGRPPRIFGKEAYQATDPPGSVYDRDDAIAAGQMGKVN